MNRENQLKLRQWVLDHQENMNLRLPPIPEMHSARNAWCHLFGCIDDVYGTRGKGGYKVIPDEEFDNCIKIFEIAYQYAEDLDVYDRFPKDIKPIKFENKTESQPTLDEWFVC